MVTFFVTKEGEGVDDPGEIEDITGENERTTRTKRSRRELGLLCKPKGRSIS